MTCTESRALRRGGVYLLLAAAAVITLVPFALGLVTSLTSASQFATSAGLALPAPPTVQNYAALSGAGFGRAAVVTALMTAVILVGQLTSSVAAAKLSTKKIFYITSHSAKNGSAGLRMRQWIN